MTFFKSPKPRVILCPWGGGRYDYSYSPLVFGSPTSWFKPAMLEISYLWGGGNESQKHRRGVSCSCSCSAMITGFARSQKWYSWRFVVGARARTQTWLLFAVFVLVVCLLACLFVLVCSCSCSCSCSCCCCCCCCCSCSCSCSCSCCCCSCYCCTRSCTVFDCFYRHFLLFCSYMFAPPSPTTRRMLPPPLPHSPRPTSRIYRRFVTSHRPPAGTPFLLKKKRLCCATHHFPPPRRRTREDSSLWPRGTVPKLPSGTKGCKTPICLTLLTT